MVDFFFFFSGGVGLRGQEALPLTLSLSVVGGPGHPSHTFSTRALAHLSGPADGMEPCDDEDELGTLTAFQ